MQEGVREFLERVLSELVSPTRTKRRRRSREIREFWYEGTSALRPVTSYQRSL